MVGSKQGSDSAARFAGLTRVEVGGELVPVATTRRSKLFGLAGLSSAEAAPGLLLPECNAIHTFGMRFRIDLAFLDPDGRILEIRRAVPRRRFAWCRRADSVLELVPPGLADRLTPAQAINWTGEGASRRHAGLIRS